MKFSIKVNNQQQIAPRNVSMVIRFRMKKTDIMVSMFIQLVQVHNKSKWKYSKTDQLQLLSLSIPIFLMYLSGVYQHTSELFLGNHGLYLFWYLFFNLIHDFPSS